MAKPLAEKTKGGRKEKREKKKEKKKRKGKKEKKKKVGRKKRKEICWARARAGLFFFSS